MTVGRAAIGVEVAGVFSTILSSVLEAGWQPSEIARQVKRERSRRHADLVTTAMAEVDLGHEAMPGEWAAQLRELDVQRWWGREVDWLQPWARRADTSWRAALTVAIEALGVLIALPPIERLLPPPSGWSGARPMCHGVVDDAVLAKIRALLAKAASTSFEEEAEAFTAKAQELMARHAIDDAVARASGDTQEKPMARRIPVDDPYADAKSCLLSAIADSNGVRAIWYRHFAMMALVGFAADLDGVELLFTSLLVQATKAMLEHGRITDGFGRSRTRSFRRSFLIAFAGRIRERLSEAALTARRQAEGDLEIELLPVLAGRDDEVDERVSALFPGLTSRRRPSSRDRDGWLAGRAAAEVATLGPERAVPVRRASA